MEQLIKYIAVLSLDIHDFETLNSKSLILHLCLKSDKMRCEKLEMTVRKPSALVHYVTSKFLN